MEKGQRKKPMVQAAGGGTRDGGGRPPYEPTDADRQIVESLASFGVPQKDICQMVRDPEGKPISDATLRKYFAKEIETAAIKANARIAQSLFKKALDGDTASIIFWLKTRARWNETPKQIAFTDPNGNPAPVPSLADFYATVGTAAATETAKGEQ